MRTVNAKIVLIVLGACVLTAGCSPLAPQPDPSKFFILTPISDTAEPASTPTLAKAASPLTIGVGPIDFPAYLRRLQVVTRESPNQLDLSAEERWGEPLDKNFARVFSENIAMLLHTQQIEKYPWPVRTRVDYQIAIDVQRFETTSDGQSQLDARWIIKDGVTGKDLYASKTTANAPVGKGETGASAALSSDLAMLSREVAAQVTELRRRQTAMNTAENLVLNRSSP